MKCPTCDGPLVFEVNEVNGQDVKCAAEGVVVEVVVSAAGRCEDCDVTVVEGNAKALVPLRINWRGK